MTPAEIRQAIAESPTLNNLLPDSQAIADAMSEGRTRANDTEIGVGMILATIGLASGNALLDALYAAPDFRYVKPLLEQGRLQVSSPLVAAALAGMVELSVITQPDALIALGTEPLAPDLDRQVQSETIDVLTTTYAPGARESKKWTAAENLLRPYLTGTNGVRIVRA